MGNVFIVGSGIVGVDCIEWCFSPPSPIGVRENKPAPHYICPLSNSLLCGLMPMCLLVNCKFDGKTFNPYNR